MVASMRKKGMLKEEDTDDDDMSRKDDEISQNSLQDLTSDLDNHFHKTI